MLRFYCQHFYGLVNIATGIVSFFFRWGSNNFRLLSEMNLKWVKNLISLWYDREMTFDRVLRFDREIKFDNV